MPKYEAISELIEKRIRMGDYALKDIPTEEGLASEAGVARMTARRAVLRLVEKGLLVRQPNGRLAVNREQVPGGASPQVALLTRAFVSPEWDRWRVAAERVADRMGATLRKVDFVHWDDPAILEAMDHFDGVFLMAGCEEAPPQILSRIREHSARLVVINADWSGLGVRSIDLLPVSRTRDLLEHLAQLGHRRIACLNTQTWDNVVAGRIGAWESWMAEKGLSGRLINEPVEDNGDAVAQSYEVIGRFLQARRPDFTAVVAVTMAAAVGAMRAMHDVALRIGQDVSVCAVNDEGWARYLFPTLTAVQMPDREPFLEVGFEWMLRRGQEWGAPLLLQPASVPLFVGASTGPAP